MDLFSQNDQSLESVSDRPLAERMRPKQLSEMAGLKWDSAGWKILNRVLNGQAELNTNLIFWGPPGSGKTSLARILGQGTNQTFIAVNAIDTGAKSLKEIGEESSWRKRGQNQRTILFIDEIHRLNKSQQDILLPFSERGDFILIGATTENPSYELNAALLSRCQVLQFRRLSNNDLNDVLVRAALIEKVDLSGLLSDAAKVSLIDRADGDARRLLTLFESLINLKENALKDQLPLSLEALDNILAQANFGYSKTGDDHYDCISAFIKSVRGSDPDAAVYYLARMIESGEDPVFIARRLVILASEDIGNADPRGITLAVSGLQAVELIGLPEAAISLAQVTTYLASAPKSNASYAALNSAKAFFQKSGRLPIPLALRSAQNSFAKGIGYGKGYLYSHEGPKGYRAQSFLPEAAKDMKFYEPKEIGFEKNIIQYLDWLKKTDKETSDL